MQQCGASKVRRAVQHRLSPMSLRTQIRIRANESDNSYDRRPINGPRLWDDVSEIGTNVDEHNRTQAFPDWLQRSRSNALAAVDVRTGRHYEKYIINYRRINGAVLHSRHLRELMLAAPLQQR